MLNTVDLLYVRITYSEKSTYEATTKTSLFPCLQTKLTDTHSAQRESRPKNSSGRRLHQKSRKRLK